MSDSHAHGTRQRSRPVDCGLTTIDKNCDYQGTNTSNYQASHLALDMTKLVEDCGEPGLPEREDNLVVEKAIIQVMFKMCHANAQF